MAEFEITCVRHDEKKVITHVGINGKLYSIKQILTAMENKDTFHTNQDTKKATVYRKKHSNTNNWFLTTEPDKTDVNNLDFLPPCPTYYTFANADLPTVNS